jgi:putative oxidoreductase
MALVKEIESLLDGEGFADLAKLVARLLLGLPFPIFGTMKFLNREGMSAYIESGGLPGEVIWVVIPFQILCGLAVWLGFRTRWAAFLLGGFCLVAATIYHSNLSDAGELASFTKDYATAGGFLLLWKIGPGRYSIDAWLAARHGPAKS